MKILAIETSCDDSCIALAQCPARNASPARIATQSVAGGRSDAGGSAGKFKLLSNLISSQIEIHRKWGGVYPALARREHQRNLVPLLEKSLKGTGLLSTKRKAKSAKQQCKTQKLKEILERELTLYKQLKEFLEKYQKPKIDLIAVTMGPGLDPCLWTGVNFAKALAYYWNVSIIGINHIEAHIIANWLKPISLNAKYKTQNVKQQFKTQKLEKINFPAICLIVSGGHTQLILMKNFGKYKILGETRDDAAGEAFDKIARILGLDYPGGPAIAKETAKLSMINDKLSIKLPRPMLNTKNYDFSFSGLKTAVLYDYKKRIKKEKKSKQYIQIMAREAQQAIIDVLIKKTIKAAKDYKVKSILLGGGVTANKELRKQFKQKIEKENSRFNLYVSPPEYCTDNAAMVAGTACFKIVKETVKGRTSGSWQNIKAQPNLRID